MIIAKGLEIIPKRDKVTYASNISGKWQDYSIETYQGKVLKDAVERFKVLLKEGKSLDKEVPSLKEMFNKSGIKPTEIEPVDLWDMPVVHEPVVINEAAEINAIELTKVLLERKKEKPLVEVTQMLDAAKRELTKVSKDTKYVITAGESKYGRTQYVNVYNDCPEWAISIVPVPMTKALAEKTLARVQKEYKEKLSRNTSFAKRGVPDIEFCIEVYEDRYTEDLKK